MSTCSYMDAKLGVKQIDLYLIHNLKISTDLEHDWREFEKIKEAGLAKCAYYLDSQVK